MVRIIRAYSYIPEMDYQNYPHQEICPQEKLSTKKKYNNFFLETLTSTSRKPLELEAIFL